MYYTTNRCRRNKY